MEDVFSYTSLNRKRINNICESVNSLSFKYAKFSDKDFCIVLVYTSYFFFNCFF